MALVAMDAISPAIRLNPGWHTRIEQRVRLIVVGSIDELTSVHYRSRGPWVARERRVVL